MKCFRVFGALVLIFLSGCNNTPPIGQLLSADRDIRAAALSELEPLSQKERANLISPLVIALNDADPLIASRASIALQRIGVQSAPEVKKMLSNKDPFVRLCATEIIASYADKDPALIEELKKLANDPHPLIQEEAKMALQRLNSQIHPT